MNQMHIHHATDTPRAWIRLPSQRHMDLMNPHPDAWMDLDLARKLARTARWAGESKWPLPLSVAQHSLCVLAFVRHFAHTPLSASDQLRELVHDAEEAFLGFDPISPLKRAFGEPFRQIADRLQRCVFVRYGLTDWPMPLYVIHRKADQAAAAAEAVHCVGWTAAEVVEVLSIRVPAPTFDPLQAIYGGTAWEPWPADVAEARFLAELQRLQALQAQANSGEEQTSQVAA